MKVLRKKLDVEMITDVNKVDDNLGDTLDEGLEDDLNDAIGMKSKYELYLGIRNS